MNEFHEFHIFPQKLEILLFIHSFTVSLSNYTINGVFHSIVRASVKRLRVIVSGSVSLVLEPLSACPQYYLSGIKRF